LPPRPCAAGRAKSAPAREYYSIIKSDACVPVGHTVNANTAMATGLSMHLREAVNRLMDILGTGCRWRAIPRDLAARGTIPVENEARARGLETFRYSGFALGHPTEYR
jgi:hypothetical protein